MKMRYGVAADRGEAEESAIPPVGSTAALQIPPSSLTALMEMACEGMYLLPIEAIGTNTFSAAACPSIETMR